MPYNINITAGLPKLSKTKGKFMGPGSGAFCTPAVTSPVSALHYRPADLRRTLAANVVDSEDLMPPWDRSCISSKLTKNLFSPVSCEFATQHGFFCSLSERRRLHPGVPQTAFAEELHSKALWACESLLDGEQTRVDLSPWHSLASPVFSFFSLLFFFLWKNSLFSS